MLSRTSEASVGTNDSGAGAAAVRAPYEPPVLEALGAWSALTLQQSVPIGNRHPAGFLIGWGTIPGQR